jgi:fructokinase
MPGAISPATGLVKNANSVWLIGQPLDRDLSTRWAARPLANDANCFALSEATDGAGRGARVVFGVIVGTGTGGGIAVDGRVLVGPNAVAGEWGHNPLPWPRTGEWPGPRVTAARPAASRRSCPAGPGARPRTRDGRETPRPELARRAAAGDGAAEATLARYEDRMARALAGVINILDPDVVVMGGGMSNLARLYESVPRIWTKYAFSDRVDTALRAAVHGDSSGVAARRGCGPRRSIRSRSKMVGRPGWQRLFG